MHGVELISIFTNFTRGSPAPVKHQGNQEWKKYTELSIVALLEWDDTIKLTDISDRFKFEPNFASGSDESCSFVLNNQMYIVGGTYDSPFTKQISIVKDYSLIKSGILLPEDFTTPSCQSINDMAYLCAPYNHQNWCYQVIICSVLTAFSNCPFSLKLYKKLHLFSQL